ncbi:UNVERIFIED_CONTAM: hypothetical protein HDU68_007015 [Siphonaria sp. JEL0065]|nr:hypothetical protein HDU68_007015 [Siphonaria sp. JEL0065]
MEIAPQQFNEPLTTNLTTMNRMQMLPPATTTISNDPMEFYLASTAPEYVASENSTNGSISSGSSKGSERLQPTIVERGDAALELLESIHSESVSRSPFMDRENSATSRIRRETESKRREVSRQTLHEIKRMLPGSSALDAVMSKEKVMEKAAEYIAELHRTEAEKVREITNLEAEIEEMKRRLANE